MLVLTLFIFYSIRMKSVYNWYLFGKMWMLWTSPGTFRQSPPVKHHALGTADDPLVVKYHIPASHLWPSREARPVVGTDIQWC